MPDLMIFSTIYNDDNKVDAPETYKLLKIVLLKFDVDVACKFGIV